MKCHIYRTCAKGCAQGTYAKNPAHLRFPTCARHYAVLYGVNYLLFTVLIISSGGALVVKVTMANSNSNIDVGELVANIVNHPDFRQTLTNIF